MAIEIHIFRIWSIEIIIERFTSELLILFNIISIWCNTSFRINIQISCLIINLNILFVLLLNLKSLNVLIVVNLLNIAFRRVVMHQFLIPFLLIDFPWLVQISVLTLLVLNQQSQVLQLLLVQLVDFVVKICVY